MGLNEPLLGPPAGHECVFNHCGGEPIVIASVVAGDGDYMSHTQNPLCKLHAYDVLRRWMLELVQGGPVRSLVIVLA